MVGEYVHQRYELLKDSSCETKPYRGDSWCTKYQICAEVENTLYGFSRCKASWTLRLCGVEQTTLQPSKEHGKCLVFVCDCLCLARWLFVMYDFPHSSQTNGR